MYFGPDCIASIRGKGLWTRKGFLDTCFLKRRSWHELVPGHMFTSFVFKWGYDINGTLISSVDETLIRNGTLFLGWYQFCLGWYQFCHCHINSELQPGPKLAAHAILSNKLELAGIGSRVVFCKKNHVDLRTWCSVWHYCFCIVFLYFCISKLLYFWISVLCHKRCSTC